MFIHTLTLTPIPPRRPAAGVGARGTMHRPPPQPRETHSGCADLGASPRQVGSFCGVTSPMVMEEPFRFRRPRSTCGRSIRAVPLLGRAWCSRFGGFAAVGAAGGSKGGWRTRSESSGGWSGSLRDFAGWSSVGIVFEISYCTGSSG